MNSEFENTELQIAMLLSPTDIQLASTLATILFSIFKSHYILAITKTP